MADWKTPNGILAWSDGTTTHSKALWVNTVEQPLNLTTSKQQSKHAAFVYPRSYAPGEIQINGICQSHTKYHELSLFIRQHQIAIVDSPVTDRFARVNSGNTTGFRRLLQLSIPSEGILQRGWIDEFRVVNKGVFDPAPEYQFSFFVVFDQLGLDMGISHQIKAAYDSDDLVQINVAPRKASGGSDGGSIGSIEPGSRDSWAWDRLEEKDAPVRPDDRADRFTP